MYTYLLAMWRNQFNTEVLNFILKYVVTYLATVVNNLLLYFTEYVLAMGKGERSVDQCQNKLSYYTQDVKKKVGLNLIQRELIPLWGTVGVKLYS